MPTLGQIVQIFALPSLIVAVGLLIAWWPASWKRDGRWMGAIAIGGGFAFASSGIFGHPRWPPGTGDASYRLVYLAHAVAVAGLLFWVIRLSASTGGAIVFLCICLGVDWLAAPLRIKLGSADGFWLIGLEAIATASWRIFESLSRRMEGWMLATLFALEFAGWAAVLGMSNNVKCSQACATIAAMAMVAAVLAVRLRLALDRGPVWVWIAMLYFLLAFVYLYSYTQPPAPSVVLLLIAPVLAFAGDLPLARRLKPRWRVAVRLIPAFIAVGIAVEITAQQFFSASADKIQTDSY